MPAAPGCQHSQLDRDIRIRGCHAHFLAHMLANRYVRAALCAPVATTSTSSGPFITPVAPLGRANETAGLLVLEKDDMRRVEQRAEDGSLIDLGWAVWSRGVEGCLVITGACCCSTSPSFHSPALPHPPFSNFSSLICFRASLSCVRGISVSPALYLLVPPLANPPLQSPRLLYAVKRYQAFGVSIKLCLPVTERVSCSYMLIHSWCIKRVLL